MDDPKNGKWDLKQLGAGGGGVLILLALFQNQGIDLMSKNQAANNQVVIEKTVANAVRIDRLEQTVEKLEGKIDDGFGDLRIQIKADIDSLRELIRISSVDRFSKAEHASYRAEVEAKIAALEKQVSFLKEQLKGH